MKHYQFLSLKKANEPYVDEIRAAWEQILDDGWYLHGKFAARLERELADLCHAGHAVACSNGLDALRLIFRAYVEMGVMQHGDEVIVPANTYVASVLAVTDNGLVPVFADIDETTMNLDFAQAEQKITSRTKAIMVVHLYGSPCWSPDAVRLAERYGVKIVEDNAQAIGASSRFAGLHGTHATGGLGDVAAFSFYPTKNIGAMGDAGAVVTSDKQLASTVRALANYGADTRYHNIYRGLNCRMDELQAAVLCVKLGHLEEITVARRERAAIYDAHIRNPQIVKPRIFSEDVQVWHQYEIRVPKRRDEFRDYMARHGVETDIHYAVPPHLQPCYRQYAAIELPVTCRLASEIVSLPVSESMPVGDIAEIAAIANGF